MVMRLPLQFPRFLGARLATAAPWINAAPGSASDFFVSASADGALGNLAGAVSGSTPAGYYCAILGGYDHDRLGRRNRKLGRTQNGLICDGTTSSKCGCSGSAQVILDGVNGYGKYAI